MSTTTHNPGSSIYSPLGLIIVLIITLACIAMPWLLAPGLPLDADLARRMEYVGGHTPAWKLGWGLWMASALGFLLFCQLLGRFIPDGVGRRYALALVGIGVVPDLIAELLLSAILPWMATQSGAYGAAEYAGIEHLALLLTGFLANGLYNLGGLALNLLLLRNPAVPKWWVFLGLPAWLIGLGLSASTLTGAMDAAYWTTALAMGWSLLWMFLAAILIFPKHRGVAVYA